MDPTSNFNELWSALRTIRIQGSLPQGFRAKVKLLRSWRHQMGSVHRKIGPLRNPMLKFWGQMSASSFSYRFDDREKKVYSRDLNIYNVNAGNIWKPNFLKFSFLIVWYFNGRYMCFVLCTKPHRKQLVWYSNPHCIVN